MISAEEAFTAWKNGEQVYWVYNNEKTLIDADTPLDVFLTSHSFELKPRTITINSPKHVAQHLSGRKVEIVFESHHDASVFFNEMQEVMFNDH